MSDIPVYFKEMPCARIKLENIEGKEEVKKEFYNLFLPHVQVEIRNDTNFVAVNCFPPFFLNDVLKKEILEYIKSNIQDDNTRIYFDNVYEGHIYACLPGIHEIIKILNLNSEKCYFISGSMNAQELYNDYCVKNGIENQINIIVLTSWERHVQNSTNTEIVKKHNFIVEPKEKTFLCFNRIFRSHRLSLLGLLYNRNLIKDSYYSYFPDCMYGAGIADINVVKGDLSNEVSTLILDEYQKHKHELPLLLNNPDASPTNYILESDLEYYKNSYFSLVTETFFFSRINPYFDEHGVFFSEKIFKPIICKHPFVLLGRPKSLYYLRKLGYKTFHPFIDESYDLIENDEERLIAVVNEVERLSKKTTEEWIEFLKSVEEIVNYNFDVIINKPLQEHILRQTKEKKQMKVAMIGLGKLGLPCAEVMAKHYEVSGYDVVPDIQSELVSVKDNLADAVNGKDLIFIAVPTPHDPEYGGSRPITNLPVKDFDYSIVQDILREINPLVNKNQLVVLISTVLPGTVRSHLVSLISNARFIYNPYLIAMGSVQWDMVNPECLIIGTRDGDLTGDAKLLIDFYKPLMENNPRINVGTWDEAEAIKVFYNTFISAKIGLVNMIQDVAERNGNINVDVVTDALKAATQRITGPRYLTAGLGDAGACHPRDNIALRYLSEKLNLGYDFFHAIMHCRDMQAKNMADKLISLASKYNLPVVIHGRAYKPYVEYTIGSYSELVGHYVEQSGTKLYYADPLTNDIVEDDLIAVVLLAHNAGVTYFGTGVEIKPDGFYYKLGKGSVIVDPWRTTPDMTDFTVIHYGNTRKK